MKILAVHAHPDDIEFLAGGTLLALRGAHEISIATFTAGDCGTAELSRDEISRIRLEEARRAAEMLGAPYHCLGEYDLQIEVDNATKLKVTELVRRVGPELVIAASPQDYMSDHENASACVRDACFNAGVPNYGTGAADPAPPLKQIPALYYVDPVELKDAFGNPIVPHFLVDISDCIDEKAALLSCHSSQREWLRKHHGMDAYIETMKTWGAARGRMAGVRFAEGFRHHLGHAYPSGPVLESLLGPRVKPCAP